MNEAPRTDDAERPTIHWSELPEDTTGNDLAQAWNCYRREVGRLLAHGHEGRWILVKDERIIGIWNTREEALAELYKRYPKEGALVHQIQEREPLLPMPTFMWRPRWLN